MFSVFIVDDENLVITSLKSTVDWEGLGFSIIGEAYDGISAYEQIRQLKPDIVFADIRMPGMSGLELIKNILGQHQNVSFVIISGYAEFAYVQKALSYGVLGYCLKPFDESEITLLLQRIRETLEKSKAALEMELIGLLADTGEQSRSRIQGIFEMMRLNAAPGHEMIAAVSIGQPRLAIPPHINSLCLKFGGARFAYLFQSCFLDEFKQCFHVSLPENVLGIGVSAPFHAADTLSEALEQASIAANQYFMTGKNAQYSYVEYDPKQLNTAFSQLENSMVAKDINAIQKAMDMLETELSKGVYNIKHAFQVYNIFMYSFCALNSQKYESYLYDYEQLAHTFGGMHGMFQYLKGLLMEYAGIKPAALPSGTKSDTFNNIMLFIYEHYCEDITIHTISSAFSVNPNYVSQLFKKQTGATFTEHITTLRVNFARNLLKTTDLAVAEVADRVGFSDYYYFTRVFKKLVGETPTSFREKSQATDEMSTT